VSGREHGGTVRGVALANLAALVASLVCLLVYGLHAGWTCLVILAPIGTLAVLLMERFLARRSALGGISRQLRVGAAIIVGQLLLAVGLFVAFMTVSPQDALFTAVLAVYAGIVGVWGARAMAGRVIGDIDELRNGLSAIDAGERDVQIAVDGSDELAAVARDVERIAGHLEDQEQAKAHLEAARRDLIAAISHDLRTPITSLRLLSEALEDDLVEDAGRREYMSRIGSLVRTLGGLIDDLFELSRLESGDIHWTMEHVPLEDLVLETLDAMRPQADAGSVSMSAELADGPQAAHANPEQIQRVLFNLIQNAIRHTPADGSVTVRALAALDAVEIEVSDTGEGIPVQDRDRVFDAFVQGSGRAARNDASAGLGLAISRAIVEAHGGRIWLEDAIVGTCVRFSLPRAAL
jgi:signal transduction histidine kinase